MRGASATLLWGSVPVLFLGLLTLWSGTFAAGASFSGAVSAHVALLALCLLAGRRWPDPLGLGRRLRWLLPAWLLVVGISWWWAPVPRAGVLALLLMPAFLLAPAAVARCWSHADSRRLGAQGLGLLIGLVAVVALAQWRLQGSARAAMPLGHHNLLAGWLVVAWPIGLLTARWTGLWRAVATAAAVAATAALAISASFLAACAFSLQMLVAAVWWKRARLWLAPALLIVWMGPTLAARPKGPEKPPPRAATQVHRAREVAAGGDRSVRARTVYARAAREALAERPLLGWGPGSVPWTVSRFVRPVRGLNPASEVVGDLHSMPVQTAYELGLVGLALGGAVVLAFAWRRFRDSPPERERPWRRAAWLGLGGGALFLMGNAPASVLALPAALAVAAGAGLVTAGSPGGSDGTTKPALPVVAYVLTASVLLVPYERAHWHYQRATRAIDPELALTQIQKASEIDPAFPLYRARTAWLAAALRGVDRDTAREARRAAESGRELAPLWLAAGTLAIEAREPWATEALERAQGLDPLSPLAPLHLVRARPTRPDAVALGRLAIAGERRLAAAVFWESHPDLWRDVVALSPASFPAPVKPPPGEAVDGGTRLLALTMDARPALSFSLYAFRRSPWPADLAAVELRTSRLQAVATR